MGKCYNCGKKIPFLKYDNDSDYLIFGESICKDCMKKLPSFNQYNYNIKEEVEKEKQQVLQEIDDQGFKEETRKLFINYYNSKISKAKYTQKDMEMTNEEINTKLLKEILEIEKKTAHRVHVMYVIFSIVMLQLLIVIFIAYI